MTASTSLASMPKLLKATYLADGESLLRETRATGLFYFPAPVFWLIVFAGLDYAAAAANWGALPGFPYVTGAFGTFLGWVHLPAIYLVAFFLFVTLLLFLWLLVRFLRWTSTVYAITTNRVIVQRGILGREFDEIPVTQVRGVDVHQTAWQRVLRYGQVLVSAESGAPTGIGNEAWQGIPRPFEFQRLIENASQTMFRSWGQGPPRPRV